MLQDFDVNIIMKNIKCKMPFYNENQFRFEFAMGVKDFFKNNNDIDILFDCYYPTKTIKKEIESEKRNYTDIVIYNKTGEFIPIELKYNLKIEDNNKDNKRFSYFNGEYNVTIAKKGATDNCRYDFLKDVERLENIKKNPSYENIKLKKFYKGYAIIISNDKLIWENCSSDEKIKDTNYREFCIGNNSYALTSCEWKDGKNVTQKTCRSAKIELSKQYFCSWNDYFEDLKQKDKSPQFKYLIFEI